MTRADEDLVGYSKDRFEANAFLSNLPQFCRRIELRAVAYSANCLDVSPTKASLVGVEAKSGIRAPSVSNPHTGCGLWFV